MFKLDEIKELIKLVDETSVQELEIENEGTRLSIKKPSTQEVVSLQAAPQTFIPAPQVVAPQTVQTGQAPAQASQEAAAVDSNSALHKIVSPMVGTFYRSPSPEAGPFVSPGDRVDEKTTVCIIEAMKLMNELEAEVKGQIVEVLVENGQLVEFGQPLFLVKAD
ncbi:MULTISPECIES: acetyl-CoA carboxylase biotin carboxyl carrier protein [Paenibacillus]|uniref:Biotin carboxyl carrier protein of acetyl-CoA carboxylase n=1 Tax=Paenibacillus campinasensis TaxID=66347 RepID=A0A268F3C8_9BACL|nr:MULTISPECIES: acetyl-CoA carboxylase biotin carboxyl carrier protein [Paenibacillus]MUG64900.1 acetyl-CoA carboxylase biotin carboxyl carrier protein [Paenibacillus campinasensis]PAD79872.1 acetyl-CoA carboxylase, biotin carboxyl carrier protein [Paenibacillus campinasensis]PAK53486.1 acetyl-CoA carboxylase, biotin carboxyl carrier protein [Paenibacillus sp. 7541]